MTLDDARAAHADLAAQVKHHRELYYREETPELTDAEYDALEMQLRDLEAQFPELKTPDSPTVDKPLTVQVPPLIVAVPLTSVPPSYAPLLFLSMNTCTVLLLSPAGPVPENTTEFALVRLSLALVPVSLAAVRSGVPGAGGVILLTVKASSVRSAGVEPAPASVPVPVMVTSKLVRPVMSLKSSVTENPGEFCPV